MTNQREFDFGQNHAPIENLNMQRLSQMVADPETPAWLISRSIASEIARVIEKMSAKDPLRPRASKHHFGDEVTACRQLQRALLAIEVRADKDVVNLDGAKFKFLLGAIIGFFKMALLGAGVDHDLTQKIMLQYGDLLKGSEERLRRDLNKLKARPIPVRVEAATL